MSGIESNSFLNEVESNSFLSGVKSNGFLSGVEENLPSHNQFPKKHFSQKVEIA
ncbi:MAG: hypothetical protein GX330_02865 [Bacteroidales bacterium]|nr:hypothetical protein [Bacteroidales bacterium]